jgi:hypothetical protein
MWKKYYTVENITLLIIFFAGLYADWFLIQIISFSLIVVRLLYFYLTDKTLFNYSAFILTLNMLIFIILTEYLTDILFAFKIIVFVLLLLLPKLLHIKYAKSFHNKLFVGLQPVLITFISPLLLFIILFSVCSFPPTYTGNKISFGSLNHEIYYADNIEPEKVLGVANIFEELLSIVHQTKQELNISMNDSTYRLEVYYPTRYWSEQVLHSSHNTFAEFISDSILHKPLDIYLVRETVFGQITMKINEQ